ncbi:TD and POZ domain-containing protein 4 [Nephila pilipes]|uniref:TD and POZ domain-containing protein 4 n=1 Tax=Nephila pilipes TaxID=299642 RepID=A0A8X6TF51_NEPPI|nr:TD and POZ domain-containing protein 4 [Nephila pilipes]
MCHKDINYSGTLMYIWAIENCFELLPVDRIRSPSFTVDDTTWHLVLPNPQQILLSLILCRESDNGPNRVELDFELSYFTTDDSTSTSERNRIFFTKETVFETFFQVRMADLFESRLGFVSNNTLTVSCRMHIKGSVTTPTDNLCFARTRLGMEKRTCIWCIRDFSTLRPGRDSTYLLESTKIGYPSLTLKLRVIEDNGIEKVYIGFTDTSNKFPILNFQIFILDKNGEKEHYAEGKYVKPTPHLFIFLIRKDMLIFKQSLLPNDVLSLKCCFQIGIGPEWSGYESTLQLLS